MNPTQKNMVALCRPDSQTLSARDVLTGLSNRAVLQTWLDDPFRKSNNGALLLIDLDDFKYINNLRGHAAGDLVLRDIASRLRRAAGPWGLTARIDGDEFAVLLIKPITDDVALRLADRLIDDIARPLSVFGQQINVGASIGVAIFSAQCEDGEEIFANAELALYHAKSEGRYCARLYVPHLRATAQAKILQYTELQEALERHQFELFYQPQIRLDDGRLIAAEALLRWNHPSAGLLTPAFFLSSLESGALSSRVGAWVIDTACQQAAQWRRQGLDNFRIAVNLFSAQLRAPDLLGRLQRACATAGLPPDALEIEI
ncbi:MAG: diguanylate cyclase, partial [Acidocella sp.]|nr:diguanylate cyclase [Acidocella sp.]